MNAVISKPMQHQLSIVSLKLVYTKQTTDVNYGKLIVAWNRCSVYKALADYAGPVVKKEELLVI